MYALPALAIGDIWYRTYFVGLSIAIVYWIQQSWPMIPLSARALWAYVLIWALFLVEWPSLHFGPFTASYQATAGQSFIEVLFIPVAACFAVRYIKLLLPYLVAFEALSVWLNIDGILHIGSFSTAFCAAACPFIPPWLRLVVYATAACHHGSTALMIIAAQVLARGIANRKRLKWWATYFATSVVGLFALAYVHSGRMFDGWERLARYEKYMRFWAHGGTRVPFGFGPGSFIWTSCMLDNFKGTLFFQMHSDWLQILWELGVVGFLLVAWVTFDAVKSAWREPEVLAGVAGSIVFGLTYYPLRWFPSALLTAFCFVAAFSCRKNSRPARPSSYSGRAKSRKL